MWKKWMGKVLTAGLITTMLLGGQMPVEAKSKDIRVALFVDAGTGYRGVVPSITLTSESGMDVTISSQEGSEKLPDMDGDAVRFRLDQLHLIVTETADWNHAQRVAQQLSQRKYEGTIQKVNRNGQPTYQVVSGTFGTYQAASNQAQTVAQATGQRPVIKGPLRLEAGKYRSLREAENWKQTFEDAGYAAYPVLIQDGGREEYSLWVGDEVSNEALQALKRKVSSDIPGFSYQQANASSYVIFKQDAYGSARDTISKLVFSPTSKLIAEPKRSRGVEVLGVVERDQRTYRGKMELSSYKGFLTLVNELSMEEYLYGVVGSEMAPGWPLEALKAQAVLARTRAVSLGNKYGIANLSDTVYEQAYYGYGKESADIREAVDDTKGEVITYRGKVVESLYYSNAGGMTADGREVWGNSVPYLRPVESEDYGPMVQANRWYQVSLADGKLGYVRSDLVQETGFTNEMGLREAIVSTDNTNLRSGPSTAFHRVLSTLPYGAAITILAEEAEENAYSWTRGPYTAEEVAGMINTSQDKNKAPRIPGAIQSLEVTERGPSGRVIEMEANGQTIVVSSPDSHRSIFQQGGSTLRSTKFDVEQMGSIVILGANGKQVRYQAGAGNVQAVGVNDYYSQSANGYNDQFLLYTGNGEWRTVSKSPLYLFRGTGFGHGLGVSQYGAKAMAESGYDYEEILQHYYQDVAIERP
ncbi:SpoIID/LytB domain-containing protein [Brevibacillus invocatus]|uniref:SpoIID/LytB domain-containing protein n=1 Tax=Brevibacillus invocatus TaxID=173959 RepID=A0A3M8CNG4_9BACL|nr:SpoIID/LytB domain-containing protein [Brevibacillus invocatus]RNB77001.1 SpoIID/LytB domain-containing protein [Brevibacillus invocatus]